MRKWIKITIIGILSIILVGFLIPQNLKMPVVGALLETQEMQKQ